MPFLVPSPLVLPHSSSWKCDLKVLDCVRFVDASHLSVLRPDIPPLTGHENHGAVGDVIAVYSQTYGLDRNLAIPLAPPTRR